MSENSFQLEVLTRLGELHAEQIQTKTEVQAIVQRLDRLNGNVARHEESIQVVRLQQATHEATQKATVKTSATWIRALWVLLSAAVGGGLAIVIETVGRYRF